MGRGTGAPDKAIEIRTQKRGRGLCYIEKLHRSRIRGRIRAFFFSFLFFQQRLLAP